MIVDNSDREDALEQCVNYMVTLILEFYQDNPEVPVPKEPKKIILKWILYCNKNNYIDEHMQNCHIIYGIQFITKNDYLKFLYNFVYESPKFKICIDKLRGGL